MTSNNLQHLIRPADPLKPNDQFCLLSAYKLVGDTKYPIPVWDDGGGRMWAVWERVGNFANICGLVRAETFEEAYICAIDEVFSDPCDDDIREFEASGLDNDMPEGWHWRGSGCPSNGNKFDYLKTVYADTSDTSLEPLKTRDLVDFNIHCIWETYALGGYNGPIYKNEKP